MVDKQSADLIPLVSREQAENTFRAALCLFVGRGRRFSSLQMEKASGVSHRLIDCVRSYPFGHPDYRRLDFGQKLSIASVIGADFTNEWLGLAGQGAFDLPDGEPMPGEFAADASDDSAAVVRAARDGVFDADERKTLRPVGARMMHQGAQLIAMGRAA